MRSLSSTRAIRACLIVSVVGIVAAASGQGNIIIEPPVPHPRRPGRVTTVPLVIKYQRVYAQITDGVAVTQVQQTFRNPLRRAIEGTYVFPLPDGVAVGDSSMTAGGKTLKGEVLDKESARRQYEEIVRRTKDPALLEYLGSRLYQARVFPIPPGGQVEIRLNYSQTIPESGGLGLYRHPLRGQTPSVAPIEEAVFQVKIKSTLPLASVFCPSHKSDVQRPNDHEATVSFERTQFRPDRDFMVYYQRKDALFGMSLLTHRGAGEPGYFLLRISPRIEMVEAQILPKDIAFVIDVSGSMQGGKLEQVKRSVKFCINSLGAHDRFNIYSFSGEVHPFRDGLVYAAPEIKQAAVEFAGKMEAIGGTNINDALLAALEADPRDEARPYLVVFMTDGAPTVNVTDPEQILKNVGERNARHVRFHVLGVGTRVNTHLLDKLAESSRGTRDYATENEDLELKLSAFVTRLANPVFTNLNLAIAGLKTSDVYPRELPDLFRGNDLVVLGRYDGDGQHAVKLSGRMRDDARTLTYEGEFPRSGRDNDFLPRLWATRKVGYLLDQIRLHGRNEEVISEVVRLAKRYGIVTPYTSALILEDDVRAGRPGRVPPNVRFGRGRGAFRRLAEKRAETDGGVWLAGGGGGAASAPSGEEAVRASIAFDRAVSADAPLDQLMRGDERLLRHVGDKTFIFDGKRWIDTAWDGLKKTTEITAFSDAYFALLKEQPRLGRYFALGERVVVVVGERVYETVSEG